MFFYLHNYHLHLRERYRQRGRIAKVQVRFAATFSITRGFRSPTSAEQSLTTRV